MPRITQAALDKNGISDLATGMAIGMAQAPRATLLPPEAIAKMVNAESKALPSAHDRFLPRSRQAYYRASEATRQALESIIEASGLAEAWEACLGDPEAIESLAKAAASQAVALTHGGKRLVLLGPGMDISFRDGNISIAMRRAGDRMANADLRARRESIFPMGILGDGEASKKQAAIRGRIAQHAKNAIYNQADADSGKYKRDGSFAPATNILPRGNFAQCVSLAATSLFACQGPPSQASSPQSARLVAAQGKLARAVETQMVEQCQQIALAWGRNNGLSTAVELSLAIWGSSAPVGELEFFSDPECAAAASQILSSRGPLGLFALRAAKGLGIAKIEEDLTGIVKGRMLAMGLTDGAWRKLALIPQEDTKDMLLAFSFGSSRWAEARDEASLRRFIQTLNAATALNHNIDNVGRLCAMANEEGAEQQEFNKAFAGLFTNSLGSATVRSIEEAEAYVAEGRAKERRMPFICQAFLAKTAKAGIDASSAELVLIHDFLKNSEQGVWQQIPEEPTWPQLVRLQEDWHRLVQEKSSGASLAWTSAIDSHGDLNDDSAHVAIALDSGMALYTEGKEMRHCVSSYSSKCNDGQCRIFSIRRGGSRVGTLELSLEGGQWTVAQFKGRFNAKIEHPDAWLFAQSVAAAYSQAWTASPQASLSSEQSLAHFAPRAA